MTLLFLLLQLWLTQVQLGVDLFGGFATTILRGHFFFLLVCWTAATATLVNLVVTGHSGLPRRIVKVTAAGSFGSHWRYRTAVNSSLQSAQKFPAKSFTWGCCRTHTSFMTPASCTFLARLSSDLLAPQVPLLPVGSPQNDAPEAADWAFSLPKRHSQYFTSRPQNTCGTFVFFLDVTDNRTAKVTDIRRTTAGTPAEG